MDRDAAANYRELINLLRREGRHSGVWFSEHLLKAADHLEALTPAPPTAAQPEEGKDYLNG